MLAGPTEAIAVGNLVMQAIAAGSVGSIAEARQVVRESFAIEPYEPREMEAWNEAYQRLLALLL